MRLHSSRVRLLPRSLRHPRTIRGHRRLPRLGPLSNTIGPLIIVALHNGRRYQSVFYFIAGMWLFDSITLAVFGPKTRHARLAASAPTTQPAIS
ncbi:MULTISPECIES: hypothetical protein [Nocardiaceae]|uniref:hypothetical protein n=1 Tax=Nocardiaceae TaxID=85025 RepID=UPI000523035D|nr:MULTISPECIES: hypothetical protein [Rhodococcus]